MQQITILEGDASDETIKIHVKKALRNITYADWSRWAFMMVVFSLFAIFFFLAFKYVDYLVFVCNSLGDYRVIAKVVGIMVFSTVSTVLVMEIKIFKDMLQSFSYDFGKPYIFVKKDDFILVYGDFSSEFGKSPFDCFGKQYANYEFDADLAKANCAVKAMKIVRGIAESELPEAPNERFNTLNGIS